MIIIMIKKQKKAVALEYKQSSDTAPRITAKGRGYIADQIIDLAQTHGIPIKEDPDLVELLSTLELNQEIPPELYMVVAELLAYVYSLNRKKGSL